MSEGPKVRGGRVRRTAPLVGMAGRTAGEAVIASLRGGDAKAEFHRRTAERYAERLGHSKGVLMKAGQIFSFASPQVGLPAEFQDVYRNAFARLQDDAPPMPFDLVRERIEAELGAPLTELFAEIDTEPLAAASIGQVHAATLPDGRRVAVKVQYPGVDKAIRDDLANTELLATFFRLMQSAIPGGSTSVDVRAMAEEVSARIAEELDYVNEAANQRLFADIYRGHPFIRVPEVHDELSTGRVLTSDLVTGMRWSEALACGQDLHDQWGEAIYRFCLGSIYEFHVFNADPHPGNYLFHDDGTVTFLDYGCVKRFTREQIDGLRGSIGAIVDGDARLLHRLFVERGIIGADSGVAPEDLMAWHAEMLVPTTAEQPFTFTEEYASSVIQAGLSLNGPYRDVIREVDFESDMVLLSRIDLGMTAVLGTLKATGYWGSIWREWGNGSPPETHYGELHAAFMADRASGPRPDKGDIHAHLSH
ncbi:ABC1 kinase family protein [Spirillospora sp. CA-294931]|uniref:ABC1 kinase family protein n=1 Tax=Spirillospora sp. CA-294931 TaxID=3240042 RepID=UPI003D8FF40B